MAARRRGVVFDVAHGRNHVNFSVARRALEQGFQPDTISSDLTRPGRAAWCEISRRPCRSFSASACRSRTSCEPRRRPRHGRSAGAGNWGRSPRARPATPPFRGRRGTLPLPGRRRQRLGGREALGTPPHGAGRPRVVASGRMEGGAATRPSPRAREARRLADPVDHEHEQGPSSEEPTRNPIAARPATNELPTPPASSPAMAPLSPFRAIWAARRAPRPPLPASPGGREAGRRRAFEPGEQPRREREAGPRRSGDQGERLRQADLQAPRARSRAGRSRRRRASHAIGQPETRAHTIVDTATTVVDGAASRSRPGRRGPRSHRTEPSAKAAARRRRPAGRSRTPSREAAEAHRRRSTGADTVPRWTASRGQALVRPAQKARGQGSDGRRRRRGKIPSRPGRDPGRPVQGGHGVRAARRLPDDVLPAVDPEDVPVIQ